MNLKSAVRRPARRRKPVGCHCVRVAVARLNAMPFGAFALVPKSFIANLRRGRANAIAGYNTAE